jgi:hypothetical protein
MNKLVSDVVEVLRLGEKLFRDWDFVRHGRDHVPTFFEEFLDGCLAEIAFPTISSETPKP